MQTPYVWREIERIEGDVGGLEAVLPVRSRGRAPRQEVWGKASRSWKLFAA